MTSQLEFVGDKVCIPADEFYLCVLEPSGAIVMGHCSEDHVDDCVKSIKAEQESYDYIHCETPVLMTAADWRKRFGKPKRRLSVAS